MASGNRRSGRVEPSFDMVGTRQRSSLDLRLTDDDRVTAGNPGKATQGKATPKASPASAGKGARRPAPGKSPAHKKAGPRGKPTRKRSIFGRLIYWTLVLGIWGGIGLACVVGYFAAQLPQMSSWTVPQRPPNARIVSVEGQLIANRGATGGEAMRLEEMSPYIPMALIAIEDHRFKSHFGIDPLGLARAVVTNAMTGRLVQGGSTLTQQLAKNLFLEPQRTLERKVQEAVLAIWLETRFSKDEILELYLNRVYFGSGAYGVDAAARRYFSKSARDVTLAEAALLAGLLKAPSRLSPARDAAAAEERAQLVLAAMRREGFISDREASHALAMQAQKAKRYWSGAEHYVADMVMNQLKALVGDIKSDVIVDTTVDLHLQQAAGKVIGETLANEGEKRGVTQGALVALDGTGAVRALVGGREYSESQFNRAWDAKRQPGSAFKPIVYLAALEAGRTPEAIRQDAPVRIGKWTPENYDRKYRGPVTLDQALAQSLNTIAAQLAMEVGPKQVIETAHRLGIRSELERNASIALGTSEVTLAELATAFAPFSNGGFRVTPFLIKRVTTMEGRILYERPVEPTNQVVGSRELGMMNSMLQSVVREGTGKAAKISGWEVAGKTGTTQNSRDALFVGYTANLVAAVWYGNDGGTPMKNVTGGSLPAESFAGFMKEAHRGVPVADLPGNWQPEVVAVPAQSPFQNRSRQTGANNGGQAPFMEGRETPFSGNLRTGSVPRPQTGVGERPKPRGILDMLFGSREPG